MRKRDIIVIALIVAISGCIIFANRMMNSKKPSEVEIYVDNKLYKKLPINEDKKIIIDRNGEKNVIYIHNHGVEMKSANCPDQVCVKTGFIKDSSRSIVCLPHKINIKIVSDENKTGLDTTTN